MKVMPAQFKIGSLVLVFVVGVSLFGAAPTAWGQTTDTFHLCPTGGPCPAPNSLVGGVPIVTTGNTLPTFGIVRSPNNMSNLPTNSSGPSTYTLWLAVFVPNTSGTLSFGATFGSASGTAVQQAGTWTSGDLTTFLGLQQAGPGPANPLSAFLGATQAIAPGTTGYTVYLVNLGNATFPTSNTFSITGISGLPVGTVLYVYLTSNFPFKHGNTNYPSGTIVDTTAPSSSILIVPEPGSLVLFGTGLVGLAGMVRRRMKR